MDCVTLPHVEKYLLKTGWSVQDYWDFARQTYMTRATGPTGRELDYPKPGYLGVHTDRNQELLRLLHSLGQAVGMDAQALCAEILRVVNLSPQGFSCRSCGRCCTRVRDAFQGNLTSEDVILWEERGRTDILRFVHRIERKEYVLFAAWKHPRTKEYLPRCPWVRRNKVTNGHICAIHDVKPIKCRAFPLTREHAEYTGCPGFEESVPGSMPGASEESLTGPRAA